MKILQNFALLVLLSWMAISVIVFSSAFPKKKDEIETINSELNLLTRALEIIVLLASVVNQ